MDQKETAVVIAILHSTKYLWLLNNNKGFLRP